MSKKKRLYVPGGANEITLKSGDSGLYVDIGLYEFNKLILDNPEVRDRPNGMVRVFVSPKQEKKGYYSHYLELGVPEPQTVE